MNPDFLKGYRTYLVAAILILYSVATWAGIEIPVAPEGDENGVAFTALIMLIMRRLTTTPPAPVVPTGGAK